MHRARIKQAYICLYRKEKGAERGRKYPWKLKLASFLSNHMSTWKNNKNVINNNKKIDTKCLQIIQIYCGSSILFIVLPVIFFLSYIYVYIVLCFTMS